MLSIIVPVYNAAPFLNCCIDSILNQDFTDLELILINDGSKDDSLSICRDYATRDSRVTVVDKKNEGVSVARNTGLDRAKGEWVAFFDADDYLLPGALTALVTAAVDHNADLVMANALMEENGKTKPTLDIPTKIATDCVLDHIRHQALWGYLFNRGIIEEHNLRFLPGLTHSEDILFASEYALYAASIVVVPDFVYVYCIHEGSAVRGNDPMKYIKAQFIASHSLGLLAEKRKEDKAQYSFLNKKKRLVYTKALQHLAKNKLTIKKVNQTIQLYSNTNSLDAGKRIALLLGIIRYRIRHLRRKLIIFRDEYGRWFWQKKH